MSNILLFIRILVSNLLRILFSVELNKLQSETETATKTRYKHRQGFSSGCFFVIVSVWIFLWEA